MKKLFALAILFGALMLVPTQAQAVFIVDTGSGNTTGGATLSNVGPTQYQFLAGQFTIGEAYNINTLEGWINSENQGGNVDAVLLLDNSGVPDQVGELFRMSFAVPAPPVGAANVTNWYGAAGIDFVLNPGTYWLAFEPAALTDIGGMPVGVSTAMDAYAGRGPGTGDVWLGLNPSPVGWGFRIDADREGSGVVPEPMTMILFGSGLAGAALRRKLTI